MAAATRPSRRTEQSHLQLPRLPTGSWGCSPRDTLVPVLGRSWAGGHGGGPSLRAPLRDTSAGSTPAPVHKGTSRGSRESVTAAIRGRPGCSLSPLRAQKCPPAPSPWQQTPAETCVGAATSPPLPPVGCGWQCQPPQPCPPLRLSPGSLTLVEGGDSSRLAPPDLPPRRWCGQPAQVALRHGRLGPAACNVPATARGQEQSQGPPRGGTGGAETGAGTLETAWGPRAAVPGASALAPEPCKILNRGCGQATGRWWVNSEGTYRVPSLVPKERSRAGALGIFGRGVI